MSIRSGWFSFWTSFKSQTAPGVARTGYFYVEEQRDEVSSLDCTEDSLISKSLLCPLCHLTVKWLLQTSMDFSPVALCSAEETLIGHWEPQLLIKGHLRFIISRWRALDESSCRTWPPIDGATPWLTSVGFEFLLLHCSEEKKQNKKSAPMVQRVRLRNRNVNLHSFQLVCLQNIDRQIWITLTLKAWFWAIIWGENTSSSLNRSVKKSQSTTSHCWNTGVCW